MNSFADVSRAIMGGYIIHPNATKETARLVAKATHLAGTAYAPSTNSTYGKAWTRFSTFCTRNGVDPWTASDMDVCLFIVHRSEETASPNMVKGDLKAVMSFRKNSGKPIGNVPFASLVVKGLLKTMESEERLKLPFEPEVVQVLLKNALCVKGPVTFVAL